MKIDVETMRNAAGRAGDLLKALANPHRLMIVCQLIDGPRSVPRPILTGFDSIQVRRR